MLLDTLFSVLESAPYSAYAVSLEQKIVFWNCTAERQVAARHLSGDLRLAIGRTAVGLFFEDGEEVESSGYANDSIRDARARAVPTSCQSIQKRTWLPERSRLCPGESWKSYIWWCWARRHRALPPDSESAVTPFETTSAICATSFNRQRSSMR